MRPTKYGSVVVLSLLVLASSVSAQARQTGTTRAPATQQRQAAAQETGFWELGTDAGLALGIDDPKSLTITIPTGALRAGYFVTPNLSLEPQLSWFSIGRESATAFSTWMLNFTGLWHFSEDRRQNQLFLHPGIAFTGGSGGGSNPLILSTTVGMKKPVMNNRLALRGEAGLSHRLKDGAIPSVTSIIATFGWSVYTR